jgi:ribosomal-protein-alanine N-acetyltransferase
LETKLEKGYTLRRATKEDISQIININIQTLPEHYPYIFYLDHLENYNKAFYVAEADGQIVGYIMPRIEWGLSLLRSFPKFVRKGHVVSIAVLEPFRKRGIGKSLMEKSMNSMKEDFKAEEVYLEVRISNEPAINLYKKLGFSIIKTLSYYYADGEDAYVMAKRL